MENTGASVMESMTFVIETKKQGGSCFHSEEEPFSVVGDAMQRSGELLSVFMVEEQQGFALADVSAFGFFPAELPLFLSVQLGGVGRMEKNLLADEKSLENWATGEGVIHRLKTAEDHSWVGKACRPLEMQEMSRDTCKISLDARLHLQECKKMLSKDAGVPARVSAAFEP